MNKNNRNKTRNTLIIWALIVFLIFLLFLLAHLEKGAPNSTIETPWDSFWYFLATVTTVGYGDIGPVTTYGRMLGVFFILLSCGFISVLVTSAIRFVNSSFILKIRIFLAKVDKWYIFDSYSPESRCLASQLWEQPETAGIIFCGTEKVIRDLFKMRCIFTPRSVPDVLSIWTGKLQKHIKERPTIFLIGEDEERNLQTALEVKDVSNINIYCRTGVRFQTPPAGLHTFDPTELTARVYWQEHPLTVSENNVILIGEGSLLNYMIEQAMLVNVFGPLLRCRYHIFSDNEMTVRNSHTGESFLEDHPHIRDIIDIVTEPQNKYDSAPENDVLCFHKEHWNSNHECIENADRIVICSSSEVNNIHIAEKIRLLCPTKADIYIYGSDSIDNVNGFGSLHNLYTPERILREELLRQAVALNDYYNSLQDESCRKTCWSDLSTFSRRSNMAAADHMSTKLRILIGDLENKKAPPNDPDTISLALKNFKNNVIDRTLCRRIEHERWMRFHSMYGWVYGEVRDNELRHHPLMVPFEQLSPKEQELDDISWKLLGTIKN